MPQSRRSAARPVYDLVEAMDNVDSAEAAGSTQVGVLYHGLEVLSGGAILGWLVLGAVGFAVTPSVAFAYAVVAAFLLVLSRMPAEGAETAAVPQPSAVPAE